MLRAGEALLAVAPLLALALLYGTVFRVLPSRRTVLAIVVVELVLGGALVWESTTESLRPHERYVPAQLHDGGLVEGHGG